MPQATFKSVYAVSSEDAAHPASNLLKIQSGKKWKTENPGEKSAFVVLQFDQAQKITGIDIGNEHAAFVEVLVGKNGCSQDNFQEILLTCSFMTPFESKSSSNPNRVRCFTENALVQDIADKKWDLLKLVCTQPFNKHVQYGLSFVKIHVAESAERKKEEKPIVPLQFLRKKGENGENGQGNKEEKQIGKFLLRKDSTDSDSEGSTSLFKRWKEAKNSPGPSKNISTAAAIRVASSPAALRTQSESLKPRMTFKMKPESSSPRGDKCDETDRPVLDRNRNDLLFGNDEDEDPNDKLQRRISADRERFEKEKKDTKGTPSSKLKKVSDDSQKTGNSKPKIRPITTAYPSPSTSKRSVSPGNSPVNIAKKLKPEKQIEYRPFNELLKGVVLVISGIQNPDRAELRRKALEMGAKYKPDWDNTCTHLICAFKNTPKYNQVKGKGKIIAKDWVEQCYSLKKKLPWRRYALEDREGKKPESEDEIFDISLKPNEVESEPEFQPFKTEKVLSPKRKNSDDNTLLLYDLEQSNSCVTMEPLKLEDSGSDTEDEIEKVRQLQLKKQEGTSKKEIKEEKVNVKKEENTYDASTEEEEFTRKNKGSWTPPLKEFFADKKFFVSDKLKIGEQAKVKAQVEKYGGRITDLVSKANFVVTNEAIGTPSDFSGEMIKPSWIYECNDLEGIVPTNRFKV